MSEIIEEIKKEENGKAIEANDSEFAYLKRGEFTSEIYKIEVRNLGYFGIGVSVIESNSYDKFTNYLIENYTGI